MSKPPPTSSAARWPPPPTPRQDASAADAAPIARALARLIPGAAGPVRALKTCLYTSTPDDEFVIDFADADRIAYCSACSGHGFKFASLFGQLLGQMALTMAAPEFAAFSLARLSPPDPHPIPLIPANAGNQEPLAASLSADAVKMSHPNAEDAERPEDAELPLPLCDLCASSANSALERPLRGR